MSLIPFPPGLILVITCKKATVTKTIDKGR
jgi:hypothetical protein